MFYAINVLGLKTYELKINKNLFLFLTSIFCSLDGIRGSGDLHVC